MKNWSKLISRTFLYTVPLLLAQTAAFVYTGYSVIQHRQPQDSIDFSKFSLTVNGVKTSVFSLPYFGNSLMIFTAIVALILLGVYLYFQPKEDEASPNGRIVFLKISALIIAFSTAMNWIEYAFDLGKESIFADMNPTVSLAFAFGVFSPIIEEITFRGWVYDYAKKLNLSRQNILIYNALAFGLLHVQGNNLYSILNIVNAVVIGYLLCDVRDRSKSILYPILLHILNNSLVLGLASLG